jgi:hypothetical protein
MEQEMTKTGAEPEAYPDAEIVDYGSAAEIVQSSGSGSFNDGGAAFYSS